ncbi:phosphotransferase [Streptomyces cyaneofuscatus]|uniref:phosphotransferase n=1 Tax=Streptomyces cyaneofuscatus TaxID=66883 RepID=UPI003F552AFF
MTDANVADKTHLPVGDLAELIRAFGIGKHACLRPEGDIPAGPHGWTHGDFQHRNLLRAGGELGAVLDWDRLGNRPYAEEVVRTAQVQFGVEGDFDLERMTDFWQLEFHYDRDDHSCDDLFLADTALLHRWTERLDGVEQAFARTA